MVDYKQILRLRAEGVSQRGIADVLGCSRNTVAAVFATADSAGVGFEQVADLGLTRSAPCCLPGAVFIDLDTALAAPASPELGRHPLPDPEVFASAMVDAGISDDSVVVAYNDSSGFSAGRLVWMLRALRVDAALLDGGLAAWPGGLNTDESVETDEEVTFSIQGWGSDVVADIDEAAAGPRVIDARSAERFRGEGGAALDPRPGRIPGAISAPMTEDLAADQRLLPGDALRARFASLGITDAEGVIAYCGSGVSSCQNLLAMEHAGLGRGRVYVGS